VLLEQARQEDVAHRAAHQKPISADTLRIRMGIGATRARRLVKIIRAEFQAQVARDPVEEGAAYEVHGHLGDLGGLRPGATATATRLRHASLSPRRWPLCARHCLITKRTSAEGTREVNDINARGELFVSWLAGSSPVSDTFDNRP
jgi:hypothetical protein